MITIWSFVCTFAVMNIPMKTVFTSEDWTIDYNDIEYRLRRTSSPGIYIFPRNQCALIVKSERKLNESTKD